LEPQDTLAHFKRGLAYKSKGNRNKAKDEFNKVLELTDARAPTADNLKKDNNKTNFEKVIIYPNDHLDLRQKALEQLQELSVEGSN
jgi:hypothetical protein